MKLVFLLALAAFVCVEGAIVATDPPFVVSAYEDEAAYSDLLMHYLLALRYAQLRKQQKNPNLIGIDTKFGEKDEQKPVVAQTTKPPCKAIGERCTYHWDCCTNACLFYLGKCVS